MEITEIAQKEIQRIIQELNYPNQFVDLVFFQFQDYAKKTKYFVSEEKLNGIIRSGILIVLKTLKYQLNQNNFRNELSYIMQDQQDRIDEVIMILKEWTTFGQIQEDARKEILSIIESFSYMFTIFNKFDKVFKYFAFEENHMQQKKYNQSIKYLAWLLLIITKQENETVIETTLMIPTVFQFLIKGAQRFTSSTFLQQHKGNEKQELLKLFQVEDIEQYEATVSRFVNALKPICDSNILQCEGDIFTIFSPNVIENNIEKLKEYYQKKILKDIDMQYFITMEERKKGNSQLNANNFTPFSRQGGHNKQYQNGSGYGIQPAAPFPLEKYGLLSSTNSINNNSFNSHLINSSTPQTINQNNNNNIQQHQPQIRVDSKSKFTSQRLLNYEMTVNDNNGININSDQRQSIGDNNKFSNLSVTSPYIVKQQQQLKNNSVLATPTTNAMEMYNWLHSKKNILTSSTGSIAIELKKKIENLEVWLDEQVNRLIELENKSQQEQRKEQITSLFYRILNEYYNEEKMVNENVQKGILVCACESVYFILNSQSIDFSKLVHFLDISWFELWKIMDFIMRLDQTMPVSLKAHILDLEVKIVSYYSWREESQLLHFVKTYITDTEKAKLLLHDRQEGYAIEKFFRRVLHQCAYSINQMCSSLKLNDEISESVWRIMKHILGNQSDLLLGRHIDQLVICSIYIMSKLFKSGTIFKQILNKYEELNSHNKGMLRELFYAMPITPTQTTTNPQSSSPQQQPEKLDTIVQYYNDVYLIIVKKAAVQISKKVQEEYQTISALQSPSTTKNKQSLSNRTDYQISKNPAIATPIFTSPLKSILPNDVRKSITKLPSHMTPQTQMLYAYSESPLLKENLISNNTHFRNINSKKMINFDQEISSNNTNSSQFNSQLQQQQSQQILNQGFNKQQSSSSLNNNNNNFNMFNGKNQMPFSKYIKPNMDSITESQQENLASSFVPYKFKKVTEQINNTNNANTTTNNNTNNTNGGAKRNLFSQKQPTEGDSSDVTNNSIISCQSTPRINPNNSNNHHSNSILSNKSPYPQQQQQQQSQNIDISQNNNNNVMNNANFLKNFTKQSQYQYNPLTSPQQSYKQPLQSQTPQSHHLNNNNCSKLLSPLGNNNNMNNQQQQPLQQISQSYFTNWQNQNKNNLTPSNNNKQPHFLDAFNKKKV